MVGVARLSCGALADGDDMLEGEDFDYKWRALWMCW
jgi:hypothetical protein